MHSNWEGDSYISEGVRQEYLCYKRAKCARFGNKLDFSFFLQDKGYDVHFRGNKVYIKHQDWKLVKEIRVRNNKLYRLQMDAPKALVSFNSSRYMGKLWHRRMGHIRHGALKLLRETVIGVLERSMEHDDM